MKIELVNAGKRFNREWIFRKADLSFESGQAYAITGINGSGKSTLLQCMAGFLELSEGKIHLKQEEQIIPAENHHQHVSFSAPYFELIEEMTLVEFLGFHQKFKPFLPSVSINTIVSIIGLEANRNKQIRYYSSGMKQRVKLAQAIFSNTPIVLLDEPCTNLDSTGIALYHQLVHDHCRHRLLVVCSNDPVEYNFAGAVVFIQDYKA